ncbi:NAD(P)H-binding protein [Amylibacter sp.]|nr:NAD(P)H-binding protein [Amylibacter sp.]
MPRKLLILGGTGSIGLGLRKKASQNTDFDITFTSRSIKNEPLQKETLVVGNAKDPEFLARLLESENWDIVLDLMVYKTNQFQKVLNRLLDNTNLYIFVSSARVYQPTSELINEKSKRLLDVSSDAKYLSTKEYALEKSRQENLLIENKRTNWTIIRPYITFNHNRLQLGAYEKEEWLYRALAGKKIPFPLELLNLHTTMTSADEVAYILYELLNSKDIKMETFNLVNPKSLTWSNILKIYEKVFREATQFDLPVLLLPARDLHGCHRGKYQLTMDRLHNRRFQTEKIGTFCGNINYSEPSEQLELKFKAFLNFPSFGDISAKHEGSKDRVTQHPWSIKSLSGMKAKIKYIKGRLLL